MLHMTTKTTKKKLDEIYPEWNKPRMTEKLEKHFGETTENDRIKVFLKSILPFLFSEDIRGI